MGSLQRDHRKFKSIVSQLLSFIIYLLRKKNPLTYLKHTGEMLTGVLRYK